MRSKPSSTSRNGRRRASVSSSGTADSAGLLAEDFSYAHQDVSEGMADERRHRRATFVEAPPDAAGEVRDSIRRSVLHPFPGDGVLAEAADAFDDQQRIVQSGPGV